MYPEASLGTFNSNLAPDEPKSTGKPEEDGLECGPDNTMPVFNSEPRRPAGFSTGSPAPEVPASLPIPTAPSASQSSPRAALDEAVP